MKIIIQNLLLWSAILLLSCNIHKSKEENDKEAFRIVKAKFYQSVKLSDLIEPSIQYIPLESDSAHQLGGIDKLILTENEVLALDKKYAQKLIRFTKSGKLLNNIGRIGEGAGEIAQLSEAYLANDSTIVLVDRDHFSSLSYTISGRFLKEKKMDYYVDQAIPFDDNKLIFYSPSDYTLNGTEAAGVLLISDRDFQTIYAAHFPYEEVLDDASLPGYLIKHDQEFTYVKSGLGEFYKVDSTLQVRPYFKIDYGPYKWPISKEAIKADQGNSESIFFKGNVMTLAHALSETEDYLTFITLMTDPDQKDKSLNLIKHRWLGIFDKNEKQLFFIKKIINDIDGLPFAFPIKGHDNFFIGVIYPEELLEYKKHSTNLNISSSVGFNWIDSLTYSSNPVLMQYRFKQGLSL